MTTQAIEDQTGADWIKWDGGECPVAPNQRVEIKRRNGCQASSLASRFRWTRSTEDDPHIQALFDIVAYRISQRDIKPSNPEPSTPAKPIQVLSWPPLDLPSPRFYLSGPMSGLPEHNFPAFHAAAKALRATGLDIINPAELNSDQEGEWEACMRRDIAALVDCSGIILLPGWENSRGANLELHIARALGMVILSYTSTQ